PSAARSRAQARKRRAATLHTTHKLWRAEHASTAKRDPRARSPASTRGRDGTAPDGRATPEDEAEIVEHGVTPIVHYDSLDRVIRTDFPDGTISRVEFDAWRQEEWDQNDTVLESEWYAERGERDATDPEPSDPQERAAWLAAQHAATPTVVHLDTLGRPFLSVAHNVTGTGSSRVHEFYRTRTELDIQGNTLAIYDAKQHSTGSSTDSLNTTGIYATIRQRFDVLGRRLRVDSPDAGTRLTVQDAAGKPLRQWDSR